MIPVYFYGSTLLEAMYPTVDPDVLLAAKTYLRIVSLSFPANALYNAGAAVFRSIGQTRVTMKVTLIANLINIIGNVLGVFVLQAGATGVAWSTTVSWCAAAVIIFLCLKTQTSICIHIKEALRPYRFMSKHILSFAIPNSIENTLFQAAKVILGMLVSTFGTSQIAANAVGQTFWSLAACMSISMGTAAITVIGQCVGSGDTDAVMWYIRKLTRIAYRLAILWNVIVMLTTPVILHFFNLPSETKKLIIVTIAIHNLFSALVQPLVSLLSSSLRAIGDVRFVMWASIFSTIICRTILSFLIAKWFQMGVVGIVIAMILDWCIKAVLCIWRYNSDEWKSRVYAHGDIGSEVLHIAK